MTKLLEITGNDVAQLADDDLRELIGLLCEADYRKSGLSTKGIIYGGHQDAPDGGIDVSVTDETVVPPENGFVPRSMTGFQVKRPDMQKSKIITEMKPKGKLRETIKELIKAKGSYIIVSSGTSATGTALAERIGAMREAVSQDDINQDLHLDFYDRGRIATWLRSHPSLILWVRNRIGRQLKGWRPYENWANPKAGIDEEFLVDDDARMHDGTITGDDAAAMTIVEGIQALRALLKIPKTSVRLTGLSGVGKTRLSQALFDDRIEGPSLNHFQAFYTDIAYGPEPDPNTFAEQLIASRTRAILIVDNCPPELHHLMTRTCSAQRSTVSLLTIEYDVRDDLPEETNVFRLEPASKDVIQELVRGRYKHIGQVDARTIADFSGGNARIAIALANTMRTGETLSGSVMKTFLNGSSTNVMTPMQTC